MSSHGNEASDTDNLIKQQMQNVPLEQQPGTEDTKDTEGFLLSHSTQVWSICSIEGNASTTTTVIDSKNGSVPKSPGKVLKRTVTEDIVTTFSSPAAWLLVIALIITWSAVAVVMFDLVDYKNLSASSISKIGSDPLKLVHDAVEETTDWVYGFFSMLSDILSSEDEDDDDGEEDTDKEEKKAKTKEKTDEKTKKEVKGTKQEKVKQTAAKVKEASPKPKEKEKDAVALSRHEQKGKHAEEVARGSKRMLGKKQMQ
ncbi:hypothetical protein CB1_001251010 [Camelus ferus]|nr:hypothetical protein CB1_001251010 [Camelus ferus]